MDQAAPQLGVRDTLKQRSALLAEVFKPVSVDGWERIFQLPANPLRQGRAETAGGDSDLETPATNHGRIEEVAVRRVIDNIAENATPLRLLVDGVIHLRRRRRRNHEEDAIEVAGLEGSLQPDERALACRFRDRRRGGRSDDANAGSAVNQAADLRFSDVARSDDQAESSGKSHEHRE